MKNTDQEKLLFIILDGWGINKDYPGNAIAKAETPFYDSLLEDYPHATIAASGKSIGLPAGQMGTSEVNHFIFGAGRVVSQYLTRINEDIQDGSFEKKEALQEAFTHAKKHNSTLHIWGLLSDGGVHCHTGHIIATLKAAHSAGVEKISLHVVTDGRDTSPTSGVKFIQQLQKQLKTIPHANLSTIIGRYYAMDRDTNWNRTDLAIKLYLEGKGSSTQSPIKEIKTNYQNGITDEFLKPILVDNQSSSNPPIQKNDALIMVNFRNDRTRQITQKFLSDGPKNLFISTMTQYKPKFPVKVIYSPIKVANTLGETISNAGIPQLRITETAKFAHLTFFLNCKREEPYPGEDRIMLDTRSDIPTHDYYPQMRALDIADQIVEDISQEKHPVIFTNICNGDMVGHTGNIPAAIKACETIDETLKKIIPVAKQHGFHIIITADHGNAEEMLTKDEKMITAHSANPVPFILISDQYPKLSANQGNLSDITVTALTLLNLNIPSEMTGKSFV